jgi:hypothetical protein
MRLVARGCSGCPVRAPLKLRSLVVLAALGIALAAALGLRVTHDRQLETQALPLHSSTVVLIGVTGRPQLTPADISLLNRNPGHVSAGAVSIRPRQIGECAAAGWTTLGAGRRVRVGGLCHPKVRRSTIADWPQRVAAASAQHGDAHLGTLAESFPGCVEAVGPGAALAAARPDGTVPYYESVAQFTARGMPASCPLVLVDGGQESDRIAATLAGRPGTTIIESGLGPSEGSHDPALQVIYVLPTARSGWLTSASTRRAGVVNLTDLTSTLTSLATGATPQLAVDGHPLELTAGQVDIVAEQHHLRAVAALSNAVIPVDIGLGLAGALVVAAWVFTLRRHRLASARIAAAIGCSVSASMLLTGAVPWWYASSATAVLALTLAGWVAALTVVVLLLASRFSWPVAAVAAAVTVAAFTTDAILGGLMEAGSLLNSRPVNGGRWYGFGNVTFGVYAAAALVLAGYLAHRRLLAGRRAGAVGATALVGFGVVLCEGWPTMGADFGGVLALVPAVGWLLLVVAGVRITWPRVISCAGAAAIVVAVIAWLDWRRGPAVRTHLGGFVQRVIDGDAQDIVIRKAAAAWGSLMTPLGIIAVVIGVLAWLTVFRLLPALSSRFTTLRPVAKAVLAMAVLGTLLNDGGVSVWATVTASFTITVVALWTDSLVGTPVLGSTELPARHAAPLR